MSWQRLGEVVAGIVGDVVSVDDPQTPAARPKVGASRRRRPPSPKPIEPPCGAPAAVVTDIDFCLRNPQSLADWDQRFLRSLREWPLPLLPGQRETLTWIVDKVRLAEARAA